MRRVTQFLIAGAVLSAFIAPAAAEIATGEPAMRLAQAPDPKDPKQQKKPPAAQQPQPPRPAAPPQAPAAQPPHPAAPAQAQPAAPPARPAQAAPVQQPPAAAPAPRPGLGAPPQHVAPVQTAPAAPAAPAAPLQRPAQTAPVQQQPLPAAPGQPPRPSQVAPVQGAPAAPAAPVQRPALGAPVQPAAPAAPLQRPALGAPVQPAVPTQRPVQVAPLPVAPAVQAQPLRPARPGAALAPQSAQGQPVFRVDGLRAERRESVEGGRTVIREPDRVFIREPDGRFLVRHSEVDRFRLNARDVRVERRGNGNATIIMRPDGVRIVTVLDDNGHLLRRSRILPDGREVVIIEERGPPRADYNYFVELPPPMRFPRERYIVDTAVATPAMIFETLMAPPIERLERPYSLDEIRFSPMVRERMPRVDIDTINFEFGSWEVAPDQVQLLAVIADAMNQAIARNPQEVFLIEGHTDAVGSDIDNLSLSDRRAEGVALALSERFQVPAENLTTQGYGKQYLKVPTEGPERRNRRVTILRITPLLAGGG